MFRSAISIVAFAVLLAGCAPQGVDNPDSRIASLRDGRTTYAQVTREFGKPATDNVAADGTRTVTYAIHQQQADSGAHAPILGPLSGNITEVINDLTLKFDKDGVLTSHASTVKPTPKTADQPQ